MIDSETLKAALQYRASGISVIPLKRNKRPFIKWEKYQTELASENEIRDWFNRWPGANIGIVTGNISKLTVLDADSDNAFAMLDEFLPDTFVTPTAKTPRGKHLYFAYTNRLSTTAKLSGMALDVRNDGGYVVAPPGQNENGGIYEWLTPLCNTFRADIPRLLLDTLSDLNSMQPNAVLNDAHPFIEKIERGGSRGGEEEKQSDSLVTTSDISDILFTQGRRDNDLFHVANCLTRGGARREYIIKTLTYLARCCDPPFDEKEIPAKINSAMSRQRKRENNLAKEIMDFILVTSGDFLVTNLYQAVTLVTSKEKNTARVFLKRLVEKGVLEKVGKRDGCYRRIENELNQIDLDSISDELFPIKYPLEIEEIALTEPKNIVVVAGERNAGKTCFCLNVARLNMHRGYPIRYMTSEMGGTELKRRLVKFEPDVSYREWKSVQFCERSVNFQDIIEPDGLNIIDYLKLDDNFFLIGGEIRKIFNSLRKGVAIIALQKADNAKLGVGGQFTMDEARLYITLHKNYPEGAIARIEKAKIPKFDDKDPYGRECTFKILRGTQIFQTGTWLKPER